MKNTELQSLHDRLENGEHILFNDYGNLKKATFSIWYEKDEVGRYLQVVGQDNSTYAKMNSLGEMYFATIDAISLKENKDIRNFEASCTDLRFLESENMEVQEDDLSITDRKIKDYTILLDHLTPYFHNKEPFISYKKELKTLGKSAA